MPAGQRAARCCPSQPQAAGAATAAHHVSPQQDELPYTVARAGVAADRRLGGLCAAEEPQRQGSVARAQRQQGRPRGPFPLHHRQQAEMAPSKQQGLGWWRAGPGRGCGTLLLACMPSRGGGQACGVSSFCASLLFPCTLVPNEWGTNSNNRAAAAQRPGPPYQRLARALRARRGPEGGQVHSGQARRRSLHTQGRAGKPR